MEDNEKFNVLPDVILMDGGLGQVGVACRVLAQAGLDVPVFGMVKDGRHRTRALVAPDGREIGLQAQPAIFALVGRIQEETHRYAITFHRTSHSKRTVASALEEIPGVGEVRRNPVAEAVQEREGHPRGRLRRPVQGRAQIGGAGGVHPFPWDSRRN